MSCHSCHSSPCRCTPSCDADHEPLASALNNFVASLFGSVQKTCINGEVVWALPCDLDAEMPCFPRTSGEPLLCYLMRAMSQATCEAAANAAAIQALQATIDQLNAEYFGDNFLTQNFTQPAQGGTVQITTGDTSNFQEGDQIFIEGAGIYTVTSIDDSTHMTLTLVTQITPSGSTGNTITTNSTIIIVNPNSQRGWTGYIEHLVLEEYNDTTGELTYDLQSFIYVNGRNMGPRAGTLHDVVVTTAQDCS